MLYVREANGNDLQHIIDIDIKCFDEPWSPEFWRQKNDVTVDVATFYGTPVAMAVYTSSDDITTLHKLAVKPTHRRQGVSRKLFERLSLTTDAVYLTIPETMCSGEKSLIPWLNKLGFKGSGIDRSRFISLGEIEDGFVFHALRSK